VDERLKIVYLSHYFPPEVNAPAARVSEMAQRWAERGDHVTILTCFPNHPSGIIPPQYRGLWRLREKHGDVIVVRTYVHAAPNRGFLKRILNFLSFMISSIFLGSWMIGHPDVLIATSPQFFVGVAGYVISRIKRCKFVFEVRDIWPAEIVAVGALKNKLAIKILEAVEMFLYRRADKVVVVAEGAAEILRSRGVPESKIAFVPNGVDLEIFQGGEGRDRVRRQLGLEQQCVVGYIGTHGMAHKLETVLEAAKILRGEDDIHFLFVGDGAEKGNLEEMARNLELWNVTFHNQVSRHEIPDFYAACDVCLVPLKKARLFTKNIPSKIYEIMASKRPIIISTEGESLRLVELSGAGLGAAPENANDLAEKIIRLKNDPELRAEMGRSGFSFVMANSSRRRLADIYRELLTGIRGRAMGATRTYQFPQKAEKGYGDREEVSTQVTPR